MRFPSINTFCQMHETQVYYIGITVFWIAVNDKLVYKTIKMQNTKFKIKKTIICIGHDSMIYNKYETDIKI